MAEDNLFNNKLEDLNFGEDGFAKDEKAIEFTKEQVVKVLMLGKERLVQIVGGKHSLFGVEAVAVEGSYANGNPKYGLFPAGISYKDARRIEAQKGHMKINGEVLLVHQSIEQEEYPSDVDLCICFIPIGHDKKPPQGDVIVLIPHLNYILEEIFNETRVFLSKHDGLDQGAKSIDSVISNLSS